MDPTQLANLGAFIGGIAVLVRQGQVLLMLSLACRVAPVAASDSRGPATYSDGTLAADPM